MSDCISYEETHYFSELINDYLHKKPQTQSFYHRFPSLPSFEGQMQEKRLHFTAQNRRILTDVLHQQYTSIATSEATIQNIKSLMDVDTFTITTGHQLNLFTGPIYFIYKIVSTIKLCHELQLQYPDKKFVPLYWMATEDHDFDEISFFHLHDKKFKVEQKKFGKVGNHPTEQLDATFAAFEKELGIGEPANFLRKLFQKAYLYHHTFADATRYMVNQLFQEYGLVILDADVRDLKKLFIPQVKSELFEQSVVKHTAKAIEKLREHQYGVQVNPRDINLFYCKDEIRERILYENEKYYVKDTSVSFSKEELLRELESYPERFSPNVMMRPLYQEVILPNLCYIGGGGELAYWFQLKDYFEAEQVPFPILLLRNSALLFSQKQVKKATKLQLKMVDLFLSASELAAKVTHQISDIKIDFSQQKNHLQKQFENLYQLAMKTDASFEGAVAAQEKKQLNGLDNLEKRLLKAQKRKLHDYLHRAEQLRLSLFPTGMLQERYINFSEAYLLLGKHLIPRLLAEFEPLKLQFNLISVDEPDKEK